MLALVGYGIGGDWQSVADAFHGPTYIVAGIAALALVIAAGLFVRRRRGAAEQTTAR